MKTVSLSVTFIETINLNVCIKTSLAPPYNVLFSKGY